MVAGEVILEAVVNNTTADVVGGDASFFGQFFPAQTSLFHTELAFCQRHGQAVDFQQFFQHIVVVQDGQFADHLHAVCLLYTSRSIFAP